MCPPVRKYVHKYAHTRVHSPQNKMTAHPLSWHHYASQPSRGRACYATHIHHTALMHARTHARTHTHTHTQSAPLPNLVHLLFSVTLPPLAQHNCCTSGSERTSPWQKGGASGQAGKLQCTQCEHRMLAGKWMSNRMWLCVHVHIRTQYMHVRVCARTCVCVCVCVCALHCEWHFTFIRMLVC